MVKLIKETFLYVLIIHIFFMVISMLVNGISIYYFLQFSISVILFGSILYFYSRSIKNTNRLRVYINIFFLDINILLFFIYSLIGGQYSVLISHAVWIMIPIRSLIVYYAIRFNIN